jgi:predicted nucleic acid-binding protein
MKDFRRHYWDSGVFCSFLSKEEGRYEVVNDLLNEAYAGRVEIVTSSFALVEVLKLKGHEKITEKEQGQLTEFFEYPFIKIVNADREVCELARSFVWKHGMKSKDAVHMATAEVAGRVTEIHGIFSWDGDFVNLNGKPGIRLPISHPFMAQPLLRLGVGGEESDEDTEENSAPPET